MTEEIAKLIQKSEHALNVAQDLLNSGYPFDASSKIYYSMRIRRRVFHTADI